MVDFVGILKKAINAQNSTTSQMRKRIYRRAIETLEHQFVVATVSQAMADEQRKVLQNAIATVEEEYLAIEKKLLSSVIGWSPTAITEDDRSTQSSISQQGNIFLGREIEKKQGSITSPKDSKAFDESYVSGMPDAELVNMEAYLASQNVDDSVLKVASLEASSQRDNPHIVSYIFSQAARRANRSSMQRRIVIGSAVVASFVILTFSICFVGGRIFVSNDHQFPGESLQLSHTLPKALSIHRKLTKRLLEDGSEIDVGLDQMVNSSNEEGTSKAVVSNLQSIEQSGEAIFYQARTNYDAEKVATGSARWTLIKESPAKGAPEESAIQGDITIPDEGLSLRLILRRNTDLSFSAAYIMDLIFILSDKFSGKAISNVQALTFKASEHSIGQTLARTVAEKINDDFFLIALSGNPQILDRNLQLMRELDWMRLVLTDKNGRINELTFTKGPTGESIFNQVIGQWLAPSDKLTVLGQKK
ncbi:hypothetical protein HNQ69_000577 [Bartonella callosciuri]|uniref:Transmembrane protein n=1 Tax=Bartonella callosciuri TaxID=686223 RepID=A0A840NLD7_9HYPH|nr:hypothetical protein [Bartonella callosciuri]MBB5073456.1 hypothetical protein [Bartonella callosciuri]